MIVLSDEDLTGLLPPADIVAAVEAAARAVQHGRVAAPKRLHVEWRSRSSADGGNMLLVMPAAAEGMLGTKLVSVVPGNAGRGLPVTNGLMVVNDAETGLPVAILNAAALTAQRTGAVGAMGVKHMTPPDITSVGIIGCGIQGAWQAIFARAVRPIREVFCVARSDASVVRFRETVGAHAPELRVTRCRDARELLTQTTLIITATTSTEPVLPDEPALLEGKHFVSVGSYRTTMQELPDGVYALAGEIAVDSLAAREEVGDVVGPVSRGVLRGSDVYFVGELVAGDGRMAGDGGAAARTIDVSRTTAYKTVGMALYDLYVAQAMYEAARERGVGREVEF